MPAVDDERRLRIAAALTDVTPRYVVLLHGPGCLCAGAELAGVVVGPFVDPHPLALLGWAQAQCEAAAVARMLPPAADARALAGAR